jgi:coenzyme F420 biosynthesis associated uncharacterized protein
MAALIEPRVASAVARRVAGGGSLQSSYLLDRLHRDLAVAVPRAEELVAEASGIPKPPASEWEVIDRPHWVEANIRGMIVLLGPLAERIEDRLRGVPVPLRIGQKAAVSVEVGLLLGYISRRVLGQYDLLVGAEDASEAGTVYFVGANMVETERRFGFVPDEFALWVAVHEITHRFQFEGVPWLRERFLGLVHSYLSAVELDAKDFARRLAHAGRRLVSRDVPSEEKSPVYLLASEEQRSALDQIQALMAVVEGHGNFVMDEVGAEVIPTFGQMRHLFQVRRRQQNLLQKLVANAIGLEMKMRQYELGQSFCEAVAEESGAEALRYMWQDPTHLPTMAELRSPGAWLARIAA